MAERHSNESYRKEEVYLYILKIIQFIDRINQLLDLVRPTPLYLTLCWGFYQLLDIFDFLKI